MRFGRAHRSDPCRGAFGNVEDVLVTQCSRKLQRFFADHAKLPGVHRFEEKGEKPFLTPNTKGLSPRLPELSSLLQTV